MVDQFTYNNNGSGDNSTLSNSMGIPGDGVTQGGGESSGGGGSAGATTTTNVIYSESYTTIITKEGVGPVSQITKDDTPNAVLNFTFEQVIVEPATGTRVLITPDVYIGTALKYITEYETGYVVNEVDFVTDSKWIKIERQDIGEQYKSVVSTINRGTFTNQDVQFDLSGGAIKMNIIVTKNDVAPKPNAPKLTLRGNSYTWNINDSSPLVIDYTTSDSDFVEISLGKIKRQLPSSGVLTLSKNELQYIGNHTLYLQPVSNKAGSGNVETISINVIQKSFLPGPDITNITYPEMIKGKDFVGFNVDFDIAWSSINTNFIDVYVSKIGSEFSLGRFSPSGTATLNVQNVLRLANGSINENIDKIQFKLLLVPTNTEGDEVTQGKVEEVSILFDKGDLKLQRGKVVSDIREAFQRQFNTSIFKDEISNLLSHYIHFGDGDNKLIATWGIDTQTFSDIESNPKSLVLKLYEPLPTSVVENQTIWISKVQSIPMIEQISIVGDIANNCTALTPNFDLEVGDDIGYQILDDLIASGSTTSTDLINSFVSSSAFSLDNLNIQFISTSKVEDGNLLVDGESDYWWSNFVKYSSAAERVDNFMYKVRLIEFYNEKYNTVTSGSDWTGSLTSVNEANSYINKISKLKNDFDSFEKFLYTSSSFTEETADSWTYPYNSNGILSSSDSIVNDWYEIIYDSAQEYDKFNKSNLVNNLPNHIQDDDEGQDFILFFNMIGQHFDILWTHIRGLQQSKKLENKYEVGIKDDLVYHMLESLGWDADMGVKSQFLWEYAFGKHSDGTQVSSMSGKDRQHEIWRRLLNNLPYLNKHKGTKRALHAAMACYGIPASLLTVMEFGGPQDPQLNGTTKFTFEDRTAALNISGLSKITVDWKQHIDDYPNSVQFRINTTQKQNQVIAEVPDSWRLEIESGSNYLGRVKFSISGSGIETSSYTDYVPVFYDDFYNITLNKIISNGNEIFDVYIKEGFNGRIRNEGSSSLSLPLGSTSWKSGSQLTIGGTQPYFTGSIDEFRLWTSALSESKIDNHTLIPDAIDGNHISASTMDLIFRNDFEYPKDRRILTESEVNSYISNSIEDGLITAGDVINNYYINNGQYGYIITGGRFISPAPRHTNFIKNVSFIQNYSSFSTASGFPENNGESHSSATYVDYTNYPYQYTPYDRDVTANVPSSGFNFGNKFRFETQYDFEGNQISETSNNGVSLDYKSRSTKKSFDNAPIDTDRLGLFFSPIKEINMDILKSLGNFNIDDYIGNPQDEYNDRYSELDTLRNYYFQRFDLNFNEYIQLVRYIDKSLFDTLESLVPARAKVSSGLLIEPHILERSKVRWRKPSGYQNEIISGSSLLSSSSLENNLEVVINVPELHLGINSTYETKLAFISASNTITFDVTNPQFEGTITDTDVSSLSGENNGFNSLIDTNQTTHQYGFMTVNSGSDMGGIVFNIDAVFTGSLQGEYDSTAYTQIGMDPDSITNKGFGLFASGSYGIQTYLDVFGNIVKRRVKIFNIKESYEVDVPQNINSLDPSLGREIVTKTFYRNKVTILDWDGTTPSVIGKIEEVTPLNGYFPSHYRNVGDLSTGLENSYFNGAKQTQATTLDGGSPVVTFTTNPNTLKVNESGRGSGEPILIVE